MRGPRGASLQAFGYLWLECDRWEKVLTLGNYFKTAFCEMSFATCTSGLVSSEFSNVQLNDSTGLY